MKLMIDCTPLRQGGGLQVASAFLDGLNSKNDIDWLAVVPSSLLTTISRIDRPSCRIVEVKKDSFVDLIKLKLKLHRIEKKFNPDVVFSVFGPAYFKANAPHAVGFASPLLIYKPDTMWPESVSQITRLKDALRCRSLRQADHIIVETETVRTRLSKRIGFDSNRISVIGNCVNPELLRYATEKNSDTTTFKILVPSAYYPHKNLEIVPAVAEALEKAAPESDFVFELTLDPNLQPWQNIAADAKFRGISDKLNTLGTLSLKNLAEAYSSASAIFLPTVREASTAVYPESFYFRRPLVTTNIDFAHDLCGDAALYVPPYKPDKIAVAFKNLASDDNIRQKLILAGELQLLKRYPSHEDKLEQQLSLLAKLAKHEITTRDHEPSAINENYPN